MDDSVYNTLELPKSWHSLGELPSGVLAALDLYLCLHDDLAIDKKFRTQARRAWLQRASRAIEEDPLCLQEWAAPKDHHLLDLSFAQKPLVLRNLSSAQLLALKFSDVDEEVLEDALEELQKRRRSALVERAKAGKDVRRESSLDGQPIATAAATPAHQEPTPQPVAKPALPRTIGSTQSPVDMRQAPIEVQAALKRLRDATEPIRPRMTSLAKLKAKVTPAPLKSSLQIPVKPVEKVQPSITKPANQIQPQPRPIVKPEPIEEDLSQLRTTSKPVMTKVEPEEPTLDDTSTGSASPQGAWGLSEPEGRASGSVAAAAWGTPEPELTTNSVNASAGTSGTKNSQQQEHQALPSEDHEQGYAATAAFSTHTNRLPPRKPPSPCRPSQLASNSNLIAIPRDRPPSSTMKIFPAATMNTFQQLPPRPPASWSRSAPPTPVDPVQAAIDRITAQSHTPAVNVSGFSNTASAFSLAQKSPSFPPNQSRSESRTQAPGLQLIPAPSAIPPYHQFIPPQTSLPVLQHSRPNLPGNFIRRAPRPPGPSLHTPSHIQPQSQLQPGQPSLAPRLLPPSGLGSKRERSEAQHPSLPPRPAPALRVRPDSWPDRPPRGSAEPVRR